MEDFNNQEFYKVQGPEQKPEPQPRFNHKLILRWVFLVAVVVLIVMVLVEVIKFFGNYRTEQKAEEATMDNVSNQIEQMVADCDEDQQDECKNKYWTEAAVDAGKIEYCKMVSEDWIESCVTQIAVNELDESLCKMLDDEVNCKDSALLSIAIDSDELYICENIFDSSIQTSCVNQVVKALIKLNECPDFGFGAEECTAAEKLEEVITEGRCLRYQTDTLEYESCMDALADSDSDEDGLNDLEEIKNYGTDHNNADTDGDGYNDGEEVANGFDPLN